jgi:hypothetical protein
MNAKIFENLINNLIKYFYGLNDRICKFKLAKDISNNKNNYLKIGYVCDLSGNFILKDNEILHKQISYLINECSKVIPYEISIKNNSSRVIKMNCKLFTSIIRKIY